MCCVWCVCMWGVAKTKLAPRSKLAKQLKEVGIYFAYGHFNINVYKLIYIHINWTETLTVIHFNRQDGEWTLITDEWTPPVLDMFTDRFGDGHCSSLVVNTGSKSLPETRVRFPAEAMLFLQAVYKIKLNKGQKVCHEAIFSNFQIWSAVRNITLKELDYMDTCLCAFVATIIRVCMCVWNTFMTRKQ